MTLREQAERHRELLLATVSDEADVRRLPSALVELSDERGLDASAALLLLLTGLDFDERQARRHWEAIVDDLQELRAALRRPVGVRTAVLDYFVNIHPRLEMAAFMGEEPAGVDVESPLLASGDHGVVPVGAGRFREFVDYEVRRARRYGGSVGLVLADLDRFAAVDGALGRASADRVLDEIGRRMGVLVREHDRIARPGEDEFAMLLPNADRDETAALAESFRAAVAGTVVVEGQEPVELYTSVGYAVFPGDAPAADSLLERAAQALYEAKRGGGNAVVAWRPERRRHLRRDAAVGWAARVRGADGTPFGAVLLSDVSREGVAFYSTTPFDVGAEVEVSLGAAGGVPDGADNPGGSVERHGIVVHLDEAEAAASPGEAVGAGYRVGVAFDRVGRTARPADRGHDG